MSDPVEIASYQSCKCQQGARILEQLEEKNVVRILCIREKGTARAQHVAVRVELASSRRLRLLGCNSIRLDHHLANDEE
jgi:hypothetical protein